MADLVRTIRKLVAPIMDRVKLVVGRGTVRAVDDARRAQELSVAALAGETMRRMERLGQFGFTSRAPIGAEVVFVCVGGARDHPIAVACDDRRLRPAGVLGDGEAMVYASGGARVWLKTGGVVRIEVSGGLVVVGNALVQGDVQATGQMEDLNGTLDVLRQAYNVHTHTDPQGGFTGPPVPTV